LQVVSWFFAWMGTVRHIHGLAWIGRQSDFLNYFVAECKILPWICIYMCRKCSGWTCLYDCLRNGRTHYA
jgi:hypothetical protein